MGETAFSGPVASGDALDTVGADLSNKGNAILTQTPANLVQNSTTAVTVRVRLPKYSRILSFFINSLVAWNSASSATLSIGITAGGTEYVSGVDMKATAGRLSATLTAAQLTAMSNIGTNEYVYITITPSGATSAGTSSVTVNYEQTTRTS